MGSNVNEMIDVFIFPLRRIAFLLDVNGKASRLRRKPDERVALST